jgi:hypothetical protein
MSWLFCSEFVTAERLEFNNFPLRFQRPFIPGSEQSSHFTVVAFCWTVVSQIVPFCEKLLGHDGALMAKSSRMSRGRRSCTCVHAKWRHGRSKVSIRALPLTFCQMLPGSCIITVNLSSYTSIQPREGSKLTTCRSYRNMGPGVVEETEI